MLANFKRVFASWTKQDGTFMGKQGASRIRLALIAFPGSDNVQ